MAANSARTRSAPGVKLFLCALLFVEVRAVLVAEFLSVFACHVGSFVVNESKGWGQMFDMQRRCGLSGFGYHCTRVCHHVRWARGAR